MVEFLFYMGIILTVLWLSREWFSRDTISYGKKLLILLLPVLFVTAQLISDHRTTYPLVNWSMYSSANPSANYMEYTVTLDTGESVHYPFALINRVNTRPFMRTITEWSIPNSSRGEYSDGERALTGPDRIDRILESLAEIYRETYPEHSIRQIDINTVLVTYNRDHRTTELERFTHYTWRPEE